MKYLSLKHWCVLLTLGCATVSWGCSGDDQNEPAGPDPARLEAATDSTKTFCEQIYTATDEIRSKGCGATEFATHSACYSACVTRYLDFPDCQDDFDQSNECVRDAVCNAQAQCAGSIIMAYACMQVSQGAG